MRCLTLVYTSIASVFDIIERGDRRLYAKGVCLIRSPFDIQSFPCASVALSRIESQLNSNLGCISKIASGFSGGIVFQGDICSAFMGAVYTVRNCGERGIAAS